MVRFGAEELVEFWTDIGCLGLQKLGCKNVVAIGEVERGLDLAGAVFIKEAYC